MGFTDLRQAYVESVIPVTEEDFNKTQKFKSVDEYKRHRENVDMSPLSKEEAMRQLFYQEKKENEDEETYRCSSSRSVQGWRRVGVRGDRITL